MPSYHEDRNNWLIGELQRNMMTFDDSTSSLLQGQKKAFDLCCELLREDKKSLGARSKSSRSVRIRARELLSGVFQTLGPEVFLLCTLGPPITKLGENAFHIRLSTIQNWWNSASQPQGLVTVAKELCKTDAFSSLVLLSQKRGVSEGPEASEHGFPKRQRIPSESHLPALPITGLTAKTESNGQTQDIQAHDSGVYVQQEVPEILSNDPDISTTQERLVVEHVLLRGITKVFNEYMCNAIRRVTVDGDLKAAITMVFPGWVGPVDCLMSLDICERDIAQLAMTLFNAEVKWVGHVLQVVLENGMTLTTETSEVTLKGVEDEAINKAFGPEIHDAINECPIRRRETKRATECVSMILTKNGAFINLSLGLRAGLQIQNKLCT